MKKRILALVFSCFCFFAYGSDLALIQGKIYTGDRTMPWAEAILIQGNKIAAVGSNTEIKKYIQPEMRTIDLKGKLVIPGINDAHLHADTVWNGITLPSDPDLMNHPTFPELLDALKKAVQEHPKGTWIRGNLSTSILDDPSASRWALDEISPDHPVWIENLAGHVTLLNTAALRMLRVAEDQNDPCGGFYGRNKNDGKLNGYLFEAARWENMRKLAANDSDDRIREIFRKFSNEAAELGITSVQHFAVNYPAQKLFPILRDASLPIRWRLIWVPINESPVFEKFPESERVRVSGVKYLLDGTPLERGAAMETNYSDRPVRGELDYSPEKIDSLIQNASSAGEQVLLHCEGDRAVKTVISFLQSNGGSQTWTPKRVRIEHGDSISPQLVKEAAALGLIIVQNPTHFAFPDLMRSRFGDQRLKEMFLMSSLKKAGIHVAIGSDGPLNPYLNMLFAVTHPTNPSETLTIEEAVHAYTYEAAYAEFEENNKGTLAAGMFADLAVLSQDIFTIKPANLPATRSLLTIVGGEVVHDSLTMP